MSTAFTRDPSSQVQAAHQNHQHQQQQHHQQQTEDHRDSQQPEPSLPHQAPLSLSTTHLSSPTPSPRQRMDGSRHSEYHPAQQHSDQLQSPSHSSAYSHGSEVKYNQTSASSEYSTNPSSTPASTRSPPLPPGQHQDYLQHSRHQYPDNQRGYANNTPTSSVTPPTSMAHHSQQNPNLAASNHAYSPQHHYSPYGPHHDMPHQYHTPPGMYRPEYGSPYGGHPHEMPAPYGHVAPGGHLSTVYSFVPIPGTHQQKRPRRRYEEIERMYKCGWNGCEKAYGTLNHLNAHVTMQSHGQKRTPEEFKEIRKEWKARKKEEETQRKAEEERQRQAVQQSGSVDSASTTDGSVPPPSGNYSQGVRQLPPLGYAQANGSVPAQYGAPPPPSMDGMQQQYGNSQMPSYYPQSPYGQGQTHHTSQSAATGQQESVSADR